jgi:hypothetical protein
MRFAVLTTWILILPISVVEAQFFASLFNQLFRPLFQNICDAGLTALGIDGTLDCSCVLEFKGLFQGFDGMAGCTLDEPRCLVPPSLYCATGSIDIGVEGGFFTGTELTSDISACFEVQSGLPGGILSLDNICFTFIPDGLRLASCTVAIGEVECESCSICDSGIDFKFDCSNIDLLPSPLLKVPGPKFESCLGLSLIPTNTKNRL